MIDSNVIPDKRFSWLDEYESVMINAQLVVSLPKSVVDLDEE